MSVLYLNGKNLHDSFVSGAREVIKNRTSLNDINVFPVADGDTGNNLAFTMNFIIEESKVLSTGKDTMNSIADAALIGARGNSGIIIAQYINGIYISLRDEEKITISDFAQSVQDAFPHAYSAISNPVEGTIITVIRDWAEEVYRQKDNADSFYELLGQPLETAFKSLGETTEKLKVLKKSNVVDSGAKGFVHFIQGFTEFMKTGKANNIKEYIEDVPTIGKHKHEVGSLKFRYCTEGLIGGENISLSGIMDELGALGDSIIVAGNTKKARIHIHTNYPHKVFKILRNKGKILQQKADDMKRQYESEYYRKYKIALVTDSIADLPIELIDKYQIHVIPLNLVMEDTSYLDKITMIPDDFYEILDNMARYPSSAQPSPKIVEDFLLSILENYDEILVITVAKEQSGTNHLFLKAAEKLGVGNKTIKIIDSKQNSGAEGLLVMKAGELIHRGLSLDRIVGEIQYLRSKTKILVSVNTLKYMVKSGRLSKLTGGFGRIINLKPVVSLDDSGMGKIEDKAFSIKSNTKKIMNILKETDKKDRITRYVIVHANNPGRAEEYRKKSVQILGREPEYIMNISTIVGMSAGVGSVAIAYMSERGEDHE